MPDSKAGPQGRLGDPRPSCEPGPAPVSPGQAPMARILVVEDQVELQRALRINLRARRYDVLAARTGRQALTVAATQLPEAIILDLGLPDIDGTELIVELPLVPRADHRTVRAHRPWRQDRRPRCRSR